MAITSSVTAQQMGQVLAEAVRNEPLIAELWVTTWPDGVHLWLVTEPISLAEQRRLYLVEDVLYERFSGEAFTMHIMNPRHYTRDVHAVLPRDAERIAL